MDCVSPVLGREGAGLNKQAGGLASTAGVPGSDVPGPDKQTENRPLPLASLAVTELGPINRQKTGQHADVSGREGEGPVNI